MIQCMQNSLLPPVVAMHPLSTIRFAIESMTFPTRSTRFNRRKQRCLQYISISHHLSTQPPQHTTPCNLLASPPKLTTHTRLLHHPLNLLASPPKLTTHTRLLHHPLNPSIQSHHTMQPYKQTISSHRPLCTHSCPPLFDLAFSDTWHV
jgi:hypothetical protein